PDLEAALPGLGYAGLSAADGPPVPGLFRADAQLDPIDWRGSRSLDDPEHLIDRLTRLIERSPMRPIGLLTHHLAHDAALWAFLAEWLPVLFGHPAVTVCDPRHLFRAAPVDVGAGAGPVSAPGRHARAS
ncbi:glycosyl transferase family 28, partial [Methylobacterium trifolii]